MPDTTKTSIETKDNTLNLNVTISQSSDAVPSIKEVQKQEAPKKKSGKKTDVNVKAPPAADGNGSAEILGKIHATLEQILQSSMTVQKMFAGGGKKEGRRTISRSHAECFDCFI